MSASAWSSAAGKPKPSYAELLRKAKDQKAESAGGPDSIIRPIVQTTSPPPSPPKARGNEHKQAQRSTELSANLTSSSYPVSESDNVLHPDKALTIPPPDCHPGSIVPGVRSTSTLKPLKDATKSLTAPQTSSSPHTSPQSLLSSSKPSPTNVWETRKQQRAEAAAISAALLAEQNYSYAKAGRGEGPIVKDRAAEAQRERLSATSPALARLNPSTTTNAFQLAVPSNSAERARPSVQDTSEAHSYTESTPKERRCKSTSMVPSSSSSSAAPVHFPAHSEHNPDIGESGHMSLDKDKTLSGNRCPPECATKAHLNGPSTVPVIDVSPLERGKTSGPGGNACDLDDSKPHEALKTGTTGNQDYSWPSLGERHLPKGDESVYSKLPGAPTRNSLAGQTTFSREQPIAEILQGREQQVVKAKHQMQQGDSTFAHVDVPSPSESPSTLRERDRGSRAMKQHRGGPGVEWRGMNEKVHSEKVASFISTHADLLLTSDHSKDSPSENQPRSDSHEGSRRNTDRLAQLSLDKHAGRSVNEQTSVPSVQHTIILQRQPHNLTPTVKGVGPQATRITPVCEDHRDSSNQCPTSEEGRKHSQGPYTQRNGNYPQSPIENESPSYGPARDSFTPDQWRGDSQYQEMPRRPLRSRGHHRGKGRSQGSDRPRAYTSRTNDNNKGNWSSSSVNHDPSNVAQYHSSISAGNYTGHDERSPFEAAPTVRPLCPPLTYHPNIAPTGFGVYPYHSAPYPIPPHFPVHHPGAYFLDETPPQGPFGLGHAQHPTSLAFNTDPSYRQSALDSVSCSPGTLPESANQEITSNAAQSPVTILVKQIEFYFSPENLHSDTFLRQQMDPATGWVPLALIASFKRVRKISQEVELRLDSDPVQERLRHNPVVEMDEEGRRLRKRDGWELWVIHPEGYTMIPPMVRSPAISGTLMSSLPPPDVDQVLYDPLSGDQRDRLLLYGYPPYYAPFWHTPHMQQTYPELPATADSSKGFDPSRSQECPSEVSGSMTFSPLTGSVSPSSSGPQPAPSYPYGQPISVLTNFLNSHHPPALSENHEGFSSLHLGIEQPQPYTNYQRQIGYHLPPLDLQIPLHPPQPLTHGQQFLPILHQHLQHQQESFSCGQLGRHQVPSTQADSHVGHCQVAPLQPPAALSAEDKFDRGIRDANDEVKRRETPNSPLSPLLQSSVRVQPNFTKFQTSPQRSAYLSPPLPSHQSIPSSSTPPAISTRFTQATSNTLSLDGSPPFESSISTSPSVSQILPDRRWQHGSSGEQRMPLNVSVGKVGKTESDDISKDSAPLISGNRELNVSINTADPSIVGHRSRPQGEEQHSILGGHCNGGKPTGMPTVTAPLIDQGVLSGNAQGKEASTLSTLQLWHPRRGSSQVTSASEESCEDEEDEPDEDCDEDIGLGIVAAEGLGGLVVKSL